MAFGPFGSEQKQHIGSDFTINHLENATPNYQKDGIDQVPFSVAINGMIPFMIRESDQAYVVEKSRTFNN
tara:strand:+ start:104 stop:313 length:210 start_codon:yes stop_codon:yes gene_type:complete